MNYLIMKQKFIKGLSLAVVGLIFACNSKKEHPTVVVDKEQIKQEIQAKEDSFAAVYNSGQLRSIGYYADDATSYFQNRPPIIGKQAIIKFLRDDVRSNSDKISFKSHELFISNDGNLVVEIGFYQVLDSAQNTINRGNYMSVFEKRDGKYVAVRDMSASDVEMR
jgi:ketosteroid isomerase-like protein